MKKKIEVTDQIMHPIYKCSFILRLWRVEQFEAANWQASIEIPETGKRIGFASLEQLFAYLIDWSESNGGGQKMEGKGKGDCYE